MSRIRGTDTKPELALRRALWRCGLRYRLKQRLPGKPDIVFIRARLVVFVDGCFWHACPLHQTRPKTNAEFWRTKIATNVQRDTRVTAVLQEQGWEVLRFWEHEVVEDVQKVVATIQAAMG